MDWADHLQDAAPIRSIFPATPSLESVCLHEVRLHQDGPRLSLRFDLNSFPENPPTKWRAAGYNRVQLTLMLIGLPEIEIKGWDINNVGSLRMTRDGAGVQLIFTSPACQLRIRADFVTLEKISAHCVQERTVS